MACDNLGNKSKYTSLSATPYNFMPIAVETIGALGDEASAFIKDLGIDESIELPPNIRRSEEFIMQTL